MNVGCCTYNLFRGSSTVGGSPSPAAYGAHDAPWHGDVLGNGTEPALILVGLLLTVCTLSGHWWLLKYALCGVGLLVFAVLYCTYLEYQTRTFIDRNEEQRKRARARSYTKYGPPRSTRSDPGPGARGW